MEQLMKKYNLPDSEREFSLALLRSMGSAVGNEYLMQEIGKTVVSAWRDPRTQKDYRVFITSTIYGAYRIFSIFCPEQTKELHENICRLIEEDDAYVMTNLVRCAMAYYIQCNRGDSFYTKDYMEYHLRAQSIYDSGLVYFTDFTRSEVLMYNVQHMMYLACGGIEGKEKDVQLERLKNIGDQFQMHLLSKSNVYFELIKIMSKELPEDAWRRIRTVWAWSEREHAVSMEDLKKYLPVTTKLENNILWRFVVGGSEAVLDHLKYDDVIVFLYVLKTVANQMTVDMIESFYEHIKSIDVGRMESSDLLAELVMVLSTLIGMNVVSEALQRATDGDGVDTVLYSDEEFLDIMDLGSYLVPKDLSRYSSLWDVMDIDYTSVVLTALRQLSV